MPFRFYNINEVISFMKKKGYNLVLRNNYQVHFQWTTKSFTNKKVSKKID